MPPLHTSEVLFLRVVVAQGADKTVRKVKVVAQVAVHNQPLRAEA
jgi:hypothetical protein